MILNDAEIEAQMQAIINNAYPPAVREKAIRLGGDALVTLNAFFAEMADVKAEKIAERDLQLAAQQVFEAEQKALLKVQENIILGEG